MCVIIEHTSSKQSQISFLCIYLEDRQKYVYSQQWGMYVVSVQVVGGAQAMGVED